MPRRPPRKCSAWISTIKPGGMTHIHKCGSPATEMLLGEPRCSEHGKLKPSTTKQKEVENG